MTTLIRPDNKQPAEVKQVSIGRIALDTTCITPAVRWFTVAELEAVNEHAAVASAGVHKAREQLAHIEHVIPDYDWPAEPYIASAPLVVTMPAELMANIRHAMYCNIRVAA